MNKIKAIFANRKFSLDGLIEVVCTILGFVGLIVAFAVLYWLVDTYPAETGASILCLALLLTVGYVLGGIINTIFPKRDDPDDNTHSYTQKQIDEFWGDSDTMVIDFENRKATRVYPDADGVTDLGDLKVIH